jgi:hypothetical protein
MCDNRQNWKGAEGKGIKNYRGERQKSRYRKEWHFMELLEWHMDGMGHTNQTAA